MSGPRRLALAALAAGLALVGSGCEVQLYAEQLEVLVADGTITLAEPADGRFRSGEVVIAIVNATGQRRQLTLAETDAAPKELPQEILEAYSYRDDGDVVAVTGVMRAAEIQLEFGSIPRPRPTETRIHVHLDEGKRYLLFDRLGGYRQGYALVLQPEA